MKLKKSVKIVIVFVFVIGFGIGGYFFNCWFFKTFNTTSSVNEKEENSNKEILEENISPEKKEPIKIEKTQEKQEKNEKKKTRRIEIYYCSDGDTLEGNKCITTIEKEATKWVEKITNAKEDKKRFAITFDIMDLVDEYEISYSDVTEILADACKEEVDGKFEVDYTTNKGYCYIDLEEEEKEPTYSYSCIDKSYTLEGTKCIKEAKIPAKTRYGCPDGYREEGIYCIEE